MDLGAYQMLVIADGSWLLEIDGVMVMGSDGDGDGDGDARVGNYS